MKSEKQPLYLGDKAEKQVGSPKAPPKSPPPEKTENAEEDRKCGVRGVWKKIGVSTLKRLYDKEQKTCREIGLLLGISSAAVQLKMRDCGLKMRSAAERAVLLRADLTGQQFGRLTVLGRAARVTKDRSSWWTTQCVCGTVSLKRGTILRQGLAQSCGAHVWKGCGDLSGTYWSSLQRGAMVRKIPFK